jgi:hypothetical protein
MAGKNAGKGMLKSIGSSAASMAIAAAGIAIIIGTVALVMN